MSMFNIQKHSDIFNALRLSKSADHCVWFAGQSNETL